MRPLLKTGLRRMWRAGGSLQIGVTPGRSLLLNGLGADAERFVAALDGSRDIPALLDFAQEIGVSGTQAATLLDVLARAGFLDDAAYDQGALRELSLAETERLQPDLAALALGFLVPGGAIRAMARRRAAVVAIHGCGRVGASVANILASAGIGCVVPVDTGRVQPGDAAPAGYQNLHLPAQRGDERPHPRRRDLVRTAAQRHEIDYASAESNAEQLATDPRPDPADRRDPAEQARDKHASAAVDRGGRTAVSATEQLAAEFSAAEATPERARRRQEAVRDLVRATAPSIRTTLPANRQHPDVAVLTPTADAHPVLAASLQAACVPHLVAEIHETTAVLGPFVQPGRTPCLRCRDLHRTARDPGWPRVLAPFGGVDAAPNGGLERPCDVVLATQLAVLAAMHVLAFVEGDPPPSAGAAIDITLPFGEQVRRERPVHPECGCGAEDRIGVFRESSPARRV